MENSNKAMVGNENKKEITFQLVRIEDLMPAERSKVVGLSDELKSGLLIKEYESGSFVTLRKFVPKDNSFISQLRSELRAEDRKTISEHIKKFL